MSDGSSRMSKQGASNSKHEDSAGGELACTVKDAHRRDTCTEVVRSPSQSLSGRFIESDEQLAGLMPFSCGTWHGAVSRARRCAAVTGASVVVITPNMSSDLPFTVARFDDVEDLEATMRRVAFVAVAS